MMLEHLLLIKFPSSLVWPELIMDWWIVNTLLHYQPVVLSMDLVLHLNIWLESIHLLTEKDKGFIQCGHQVMISLNIRV